MGAEVASFLGHVDCSGSVTFVDALKILRYVAQLPVSQTEPCPDVAAVQVTKADRRAIGSNLAEFGAGYRRESV